MRKMNILLLRVFVVLVLLNITTVFLRAIYIFYYNYTEYISFALFCVVIGITVLLLNKNSWFTFLVSGIVISLIIGCKLSIYPYFEQPDVIGRLKDTLLLLEGISLEHIPYGGFPGYMYIFSFVYVVIGDISVIDFHYAVYMLLILYLISMLYLIQEKVLNNNMFILIFATSGLVFSFLYISPQLISICQSFLMIYLMLITGIYSRIQRDSLQFKVLSLVLFSSIVVTHAETTISAIFIIMFYYLCISYVYGGSIVSAIKKTIPYYVIFLIYIIMQALENYTIRSNISRALRMLLYYFTISPSKPLGAVSYLKPEYVKMLDTMVYLYNVAIALFVMGWGLQNHKRILNTLRDLTRSRLIFFSGAMLLSTIVAMLVIFVLDPHFVFRPIFFASLFLSILFTTIIRDWGVVSQTKLVAVVSLVVLLAFSFPARISPYEWNITPEDMKAFQYIAPRNPNEIYAFGVGSREIFAYYREDIKTVYISFQKYPNRARYLVITTDVNKIKYLKNYYTWMSIDKWKDIRRHGIIERSKIYCTSRYEIFIGENG